MSNLADAAFEQLRSELGGKLDSSGNHSYRFNLPFGDGISRRPAGFPKGIGHELGVFRPAFSTAVSTPRDGIRIVQLEQLVSLAMTHGLPESYSISINVSGRKRAFEDLLCFPARYPEIVNDLHKKGVRVARPYLFVVRPGGSFQKRDGERQIFCSSIADNFSILGDKSGQIQPVLHTRARGVSYHMRQAVQNGHHVLAFGKPSLRQAEVERAIGGNDEQPVIGLHVFVRDLLYTRPLTTINYDVLQPGMALDV